MLRDKGANAKSQLHQKNDQTKKYQQALLGVRNAFIGTHRNPLAEKSLLIP
jgi:hypothetical protein